MSSTFTRATHWAVALILMASAHAFAADGVIKSASGDIFVNGAAASQGDEVSSGDTLKTAFGAWMVVEMDDQSVLDVRSNTEVELTDYVYNPATPESNNQDVNVVDGTLRYASGLIGKNDYDDVAVRAGDYTVGIRGTRFELIYNRTTGNLTVRVASGGIGVSLKGSTIEINGKPLVLEPGKELTVEPNEDDKFVLKETYVDKNVIPGVDVETDKEYVLEVKEDGDLAYSKTNINVTADVDGQSVPIDSASGVEGQMANSFNQAIINTDE